MSREPVRLSVVVPVFDEVGTVEAAVRRVRALPVDLEIICVDDGSSDGSAALLERLRAEGVVDELVTHDRNAGKGAAVRAGIRHARGEILVVQDADLEYDPTDLPAMMVPILEGRADAVFGSRFLTSRRGGCRPLQWAANVTLTRLSNLCTDLPLTDMETGYKMVRTATLRGLPLRATRFGIEPELAARLAQAGARVLEVPIRYRARPTAAGKKIGWLDGVAAVWHILRALLPPEGTARVTAFGSRPTSWRSAA